MQTLAVRQERGKRIAAGCRLIRKDDDLWMVPSQTVAGRFYEVNLATLRCTCPDCDEGGWMCKHIHAVQLTTAVESNGRVVIGETMKITKPTYPQNWPAYNAAQTSEKRHMEALLGGLCDGILEPPQEKGRRRLPLRDVIYASTMKVYTTFSGRRATTDIDACRERGYIVRTPHYNSVFNYLAKPELTPLLKRLIQESAGPLRAVEHDFAVDATGFTTSTFHRWYDHRYGRQQQRRRWVKAHAMCGARTNVVTSVEVTEGNANDAPEFADLVKTTARTFEVQRVSADLAYLSYQNLAAAEAVGAQPYIPFKTNSTGTGTEAWQRLWHLFWFRRTTFDKHYHQRSNVESTFSMIKRKFGPNVRSKRPEAQYNEVLCKVLCHNIVVLVHEMHELGIDPTFASADHVHEGPIATAEGQP